MTFSIIQIGSGARGSVSVSVCACRRLFIKLHITTESGTIMPVILFYLPWFSEVGLNDTCACLSVYL